MTRRISYLALAALSFLAVARLIDRLGPHPQDEVGHKLRYFEEHRDAFDLLAVGSSRTFAGVIPELLDAELKARGTPLSSVNLAMNAMHTHEADALIRRVLAMEPARLRWVLIELDHWTGVIHPGKELQPRTFLWHDSRTTLAAMRSTVLYYRPPDRRAKLLLSHLRHLGGEVTALGRGPQTVRHLWHGGETPAYPAYLRHDRGYNEPGWRIHEENFALGCGAAAGEDQLAFYRKRIERLNRKKDAAADLEGYDVRALRNQIEALRRAGVVPIYLVLPRTKATPDFLLLEQQGILEHLLAFNDPEAYPALYDLEQRHDCEHLNRRGAEVLSTLIAERLAPLVALSGSP